VGLRATLLYCLVGVGAGVLPTGTLDLNRGRELKEARLRRSRTSLAVRIQIEEKENQGGERPSVGAESGASVSPDRDRSNDVNVLSYTLENPLNPRPSCLLLLLLRPTQPLFSPSAELPKCPPSTLSYSFPSLVLLAPVTGSPHHLPVLPPPPTNVPTRSARVGEALRATRGWTRKRRGRTRVGRRLRIGRGDVREKARGRRRGRKQGGYDGEG
jgi:hypothetical protein